jgi:hypothetical protein
MLKCFPRIFSKHTERMKYTQKEMLTFNNALGLERERISKKSNGGLNTGL